jgi:hypothetical protein
VFVEIDCHFSIFLPDRVLRKGSEPAGRRTEVSIFVSATSRCAGIFLLPDTKILEVRNTAYRREGGRKEGREGERKGGRESLCIIEWRQEQ